MIEKSLGRKLGRVEITVKNNYCTVQNSLKAGLHEASRQARQENKLEKTKFYRMYRIPKVLPNDAFRKTGNFPHKGLF